MSTKDINNRKFARKFDTIKNIWIDKNKSLLLHKVDKIKISEISALKSEYDAVIAETNNEVEHVCKSRANTEQKMKSKSSWRRRGFKSKPSFSEKNPFHGFFSSPDLAEISYTSILSEAGKQAGPSKETEL
jgi:hypothetical protein